mgnify:CR=1 FL=1
MCYIATIGYANVAVGDDDAVAAVVTAVADVFTAVVVVAKATTLQR